MSDRTWRQLREPWERLCWARERKFTSAAEAARSLGMKEGTYRAYERPPDASKATRLDYEAARDFARKFGVSWAWLLNDVGSPDDVVRIADREDELWAVYQQLTEEQRQHLIAIAKTFLAEAANQDAGENPPTGESPKKAHSGQRR